MHKAALGVSSRPVYLRSFVNFLYTYILPPSLCTKNRTGRRWNHPCQIFQALSTSKPRNTLSSTVAVRMRGGGCPRVVPESRRRWHVQGPSRRQIRPTSWYNKLSSGQACLLCEGSCSTIHGRYYFGDVPGDGIVESPPPPPIR